MKTFNVEFEDTKLKILVPETHEEMKKGLSGRRRMGSGLGMLFIFEESGPMTMNMYDMEFPLHMIFFNDDWEIIDREIMKPKEDIHVEDNVKYVLEVNKNVLSDVKVGDELEPDSDAFENYLRKLNRKRKNQNSTPTNIIVSITQECMDKHHMLRRGGKIKPVVKDVELKQEHMQVLDDEGTILMNIKGGERIFSRKHTDMLIKMALDVKEGRASKTELGKLMAEIIEIQDNQEPEYVEDDAE